MRPCFQRIISIREQGFFYCKISHQLHSGLTSTSPHFYKFSSTRGF
ncbi:hypothetical protein CLOHYLEM_06713 [[Clostridium] hylemonae DSM 15053]|uniref:Uncharacterized protein n=1 Tax=[Clostridium] hylemonae DSM 15053 TaxID=553973 RepID=C0C3Q1_9FIRM|nr:hypothetical protein CLOHYLEM_06713 [[Clostridium] hylemonae DSM 15053]